MQFVGAGLAPPVIASRGKPEIRRSVAGAAIQCRERNIRMLSSRHWIASPMSIVRISRFPRLAKTAHGAGTKDDASQ
ncbi:MAG: hypothetical protein LBM98_12470 [Oscillospiraceae bacterium]|nr:hypothetical protein [Oscillospiraceae bacterium]